MIPLLNPSSDSSQHFHYCPAKQQIVFANVVNGIAVPCMKKSQMQYARIHSSLTNNTS